MADEWGVPEVNQWWLPDANACPPIVRSVQSFMEDRVPQEEGQSRSEDQRHIKGIFSKLSLHDRPRLQGGSDHIVGITTSSVFNQATVLAGGDQQVQGMTADLDMGSDVSTLGESQPHLHQEQYGR